MTKAFLVTLAKAFLVTLAEARVLLLSLWVKVQYSLCVFNALGSWRLDVF